MSDHERIWLQNAGDASYCDNRLWCQNDVWSDDPENGKATEYVRVDLYNTLAAELAGARDEIEALEAKVRSLAPHGTCGCSYDAPDDVCLHHSPRLAAAVAELVRARAALEKTSQVLFDHFGDPYSDDGWQNGEVRDAWLGSRAVLEVDRDEVDMERLDT